ncbi:MAG: nucleotidyltransferase domain-containing protein [Anaerolineae bacterium]|nr:nucleotidyltransferase domain-containing protein [Anaerolineae bacterium]
MTELEEIVRQLREMGACRIILFGSRARGRARRESDIDLLVIMDDDRTFKERMREIYARLETDADVDILAYSPEEFERIRNRSFFRRVLAEGKVLYEA